MAIIVRDRLTGQAKNIAQSAIKKQIAAGDMNLVNLQQQRSIIGAQQQALVAQTGSTLGSIQDNIYQTKRAAKAQSALLGMSSEIASLREISQTEDLIANELSNVINQTEQGAITLSGQQSAINKAEVQAAAPTILDEYTNTLIKEGKAQRDYGGEALAGITGALTGALAGLGIGIGGTMASKALLNPASGFIKKGVAGAALLGGTGFLAGQIGNMVNTIDSNYLGGEGNAYDNTLSNNIATGLTVGGGLLGAGMGLVDKSFIKKDSILGESWRTKALNSKVLNKSLKAVAKEAGEEAVEAVGKGFASTIGGALKKGSRNVVNKASGVFKVNPWVMGISAGLGALVGGLNAGLDKKYTLDLNAIRGDDTFAQFESMGLDMEKLQDIIKTK